MKIIALCIIAVFHSALLSAQYSWQNLPNAPGSYRHDDMYFLNPLKGWAINPYYGDFSYFDFNPIQYASVATTDDGGQTWQTIFDSSTTYIRSVGFADSLNGWFGNLADTTITKDTNFMYRTVDGGHNWMPVLNFTGPRPKGICGISVVNDSVVYAYGRYYGPAVLMKTTDRGQSWISQDMSTYASGLVDAWFINADTGFVCGSIDTQQNSVILSTFDGGNTWQIRHQTNRSHEICWKIFFPSRNVGYASIEYIGETEGYGLPDSTHYLKTTDGGLTWQDNVFLIGAFYDEEGIGFINDSVGWIGGDAHTYKTLNGGETWEIDPTFGVEVPPYSIVEPGFHINRFRKFGDTLMYSAGNSVYKLEVPVATTGIVNNNASINSISIAPNPFNGNFELTFNAQGLTDIPKLQLYDIVGLVILNDISIHVGINKIETPGMKPGMYFYEIKANNERLATGKIIEQ